MTENLVYFWHCARAHYRFGVAAAVVLQILMLVVLYRDVHASWISLDLSLWLGIKHVWAVFLRSFLDVLVEVLTLGVALPFLGAFALQAVDISPATHRLICNQQRLLTFCHVILCAVMAFSLVLARSMQDISGYSYEGGTLSFTFKSWHDSVVLSIVKLATLAAGSLTVLVGLASVLFPTKGLGPAVREYLQRSHLLDVGGAFAPVYGGGRLDFNAGALAPEIYFVRRRTDKLVAAYQRLIPGSQRASDFLVKQADECRKLFHQIRFPAVDSGNVGIDFFPGTSRALEVALAAVKGPKLILVSPFEHESVHRVVDWYRTVDTASTKLALECPLDVSWNHQQEKIISAIGNVLKRERADNSGREPVLIISEVCPITGQVIPIRLLLDALHVHLERLRLPMPTIVLDGAHACAAKPNVLVDSWDERIKYYVVSGHKWLLAPEPCGILAYRRSPAGAGNDGRVLAYDGLRDGDKSLVSTFSFRTIFGLLASLEMLANGGVERFRKRGLDALELFAEAVKSKAVIVGSKDWLARGCVIAIRPKDGHYWGHAKSIDDLQEAFDDDGIHVLVGATKKGSLLVRICFSHFVDRWKLKRLQRKVLAEILSNRDRY